MHGLGVGCGHTPTPLPELGCTQIAWPPQLSAWTFHASTWCQNRPSYIHIFSTNEKINLSTVINPRLYRSSNVLLVEMEGPVTGIPSVIIIWFEKELVSSPSMNQPTGIWVIYGKSHQIPIKSHEAPPLNHHVPIVFLWFPPLFEGSSQLLIPAASLALGISGPQLQAALAHRFELLQEAWQRTIIRKRHIIVSMDLG